MEKKTDAIAPTEGAWIAHWAGSNPYKGWSIRQGRDEVIWLGEGISSETVEAIVLAHNKCFDCESTVCVMNCSGRTPSPEAPAVDALTLTKEQRDAIEWAAGRAHVAALGRPINGVEGQRWRELTDLFRAVPEQLSTEPMAAQPISDAMMDLVDRLGGEAKDVDPRAWQHLLVYAPKPAVEALRATPTPLADAASAEREAFEAWEAYLNEQKHVLGMPGLTARPCFIAGYRAALTGAKE